MSLIYLVHDLADPAVARRLRILRMAGGTPVLMGFRRSDAPVLAVDGVGAIDLGRTEDARLGRRALSVFAQGVRLGRLRHLVAGAEVILARNLEMLVLAWLLRRRFVPRARLVFECLDIHSSLVSPSLKGHLMRAVEGRLLRHCDGLMVSSPAFVTEHFDRLGIDLPPVRLVENKVLAGEFSPPAPGLPAGPPWRIGWFGVIRCRRSLALLTALAHRLEGLVEIDIRGRPARNVLPEFDATVAATPGMAFHGPYRRDSDLAEIYGAVHFSWALDFYEAGSNSDWLLPNRLYEGGAQGTVPIALDRVETGRWLQARGAGAVLAEPLDQTLPALIAAMTAERYARLRQMSSAVPVDDMVCTDREALEQLAWLKAPTLHHRAVHAPSQDR